MALELAAICAASGLEPIAYRRRPKTVCSRTNQTTATTSRMKTSIPGRRNRKRAIRYDQQRYRGRHLIENAFCRLKDFRRIATRYDKLAANFLSGVALATAVAFWL